MLISVAAILVFLLVLYAAALFGAVYISIHPPRTPIFLSPGYLGTPQESVAFTSSDGIPLKAWWVDAGEDRVALLAHGYVMNRAELAGTAAHLYKQGISSLLIDFRGHGGSGNAVCSIGPNEAEDIVAALSFIEERVPGAKIVGIGSSMGAAACAFAAAKAPKRFAGLVMDCAYNNLGVASSGWWLFVGGKPLKFALSPVVYLAGLVMRRNPFLIRVDQALAACEELPVLFLHGDRDSLAAPEGCILNESACKGRSKIVWFEGCGHAEGRWLQPERYFSALDEFLQEISF